MEHLLELIELDFASVTDVVGTGSCGEKGQSEYCVFVKEYHDDMGYRQEKIGWGEGGYTAICCGEMVWTCMVFVEDR